MSPLVIVVLSVWGVIGLGGIVCLLVAQRRPATDDDRRYSRVDVEIDARERARRLASERAAQAALGYIGPRHGVEAATRDCPVDPMAGA